MNYRIYQNITGWEYVTTTYKDQLKRVVSSLKSETLILIVEHDIKHDIDDVYYQGYAGDYTVKVKKKIRSDIHA